MDIGFSPYAGEFYNANDGVRFRLRQKVDPTINYTNNPIPSYIAASSHIIGKVPTRNTSASYPYWRFNLRHELSSVLPFPNQPVDTFFDVLFIQSGDGFVLDNSGLVNSSTITVPIATSANDLVIEYPTNDADPPIVTAINASDSFDYTIDYQVGAGKVSRENFGTFGNGRANTLVDVHVTFPTVPSSGNTKFYNQLNIYRPSGTWLIQFNLALRQYNHNSHANTY